MDKLKICHVALALYPDKKDGAAYFSRGLYDTLKKRGHDITYLTVKWEEGFSDPDIHTIKVPNARFLWLPKFVVKYREYLKNHDFDIIHGSGSRGSLPILCSGKPYITSIYDLGPFEASFTRIPIVKWLERINAQKARQIVTISEISKSGIVKHMGTTIDKIYNVFCAYNPTFQPHPEEAEKLKEKLNISGPILYYVGRIAFYKGVEDIIKAFYLAKKEIPDLNLVIGGKPTIKMENAYKSWNSKYPEVKFIGSIKEEEMATYYSMADSFVTYSFASEGFGITPVEAIACGTPVICSSMPAYKEILEDHALFVEPKRPDLLANAFLEFFKNQDYYRDKLSHAREFIKKYTWDRVTDRVEEVYRIFLEQSSVK